MLCPGSLGPFLNQHCPYLFLPPMACDGPLPPSPPPLSTSFCVGCDPLLSQLLSSLRINAVPVGPILWILPSRCTQSCTLSTMFSSWSCSLLLKPWTSPTSHPGRLGTWILLITSRLVMTSKVPGIGDILGSVLMF